MDDMIVYKIVEEPTNQKGYIDPIIRTPAFMEKMRDSLSWPGVVSEQIQEKVWRFVDAATSSANTKFSNLNDHTKQILFEMMVWEILFSPADAIESIEYFGRKYGEFLSMYPDDQLHAYVRIVTSDSPRNISLKKK